MRRPSSQWVEIEDARMVPRSRAYGRWQTIRRPRQSLAHQRRQRLQAAIRRSLLVHRRYPKREERRWARTTNALRQSFGAKIAPQSAPRSLQAIGPETPFHFAVESQTRKLYEFRETLEPSRWFRFAAPRSKKL